VTLTGSGAYIDLPVGEVGAGEADGELITPAGNRHGNGTQIRAWTLGYGGSAAAGLAFHTRGPFHVFGEYGYTWMRSATKWTYRAGWTTLDKAGVSAVATRFVVDGAGFRIGIGF
jgi:hypothetical protein